MRLSAPPAQGAVKVNTPNSVEEPRERLANVLFIDIIIISDALLFFFAMLGRISLKIAIYSRSFSPKVLLLFVDANSITLL
jgi:hypothetical protein